MMERRMKLKDFMDGVDRGKSRDYIKGLPIAIHCLLKF